MKVRIGKILFKDYLEQQLKFIDDDQYCRMLLESHIELYKKYEELQKKANLALTDFETEETCPLCRMGERHQQCVED